MESANVRVGSDHREIEESDDDNQGQEIVEKKFHDRIMSIIQNPSPFVLLHLASIMESRISMFTKISQTIEDSFKVISSFLYESRNSYSVKAAAVRLLCTWYQHLDATYEFDEYLMENIMRWAVEDTRGMKSRDREMLRTYSTGLLAECLNDDSKTEEHALKSGLTEKIMGCLRLKLLGDVLSNMDKVDEQDSVHVHADVLWAVESSHKDEEFDEEESEDLLDNLRKLRINFCIKCLRVLGQNAKVIQPLINEKGVDVCLLLLQRSSKDASIASDVLDLIVVLLDHRKFATKFVDQGGIQNLLSVPRVADTFIGLSNCLFKIGSMKVLMSRVCALSSSSVEQVVDLALKLFECPQDRARKKVLLFFRETFVFRAILYKFDSRDGLQKLLTLLHDVVSLGSGVSFGSLPSYGSRTELMSKTEKKLAFHACVALNRYLRAHWIDFGDSFGRGSRIDASTPLDISDERVDDVLRQIQSDGELGLFKKPFAAVDTFLNSYGHITMLYMCQVAQGAPSKGFLHDLQMYALGVLETVSLIPYGSQLIAAATVSNDRVGTSIILDAASGSDYPEIIYAALRVLLNLVCHPPSISKTSPVVANVEQGYRQAREAVLDNNGIKVLLEHLQPDSGREIHRALACKVLLGLARDDNIARTLSKLQVRKKLLEMIRYVSRTPVDEQNRLQRELVHVANQLIRVVTGTVKDRADIADSTPVTYNSRELLLLIHEHLQASGLDESAATLLKEAELMHFPSLLAHQIHQTCPSERTTLGFMSDQKSVLMTTNAQSRHTTPSTEYGVIKPSDADRPTLDYIVVQYLKQQHKQCAAPIATLPPLSLMHKHVCPEQHRSLDAPPNVTARLSTRELKNKSRGFLRSREDLQFVYSRFRPWRSYGDDAGALLTCISFLGDTSHIAVASATGKVIIYNFNENEVVESYDGHQSHVSSMQSYFSGATGLILSSASDEVGLWESISMSDGPKKYFVGCTSARFSNDGTKFSSLSSDLSQREVRLYDINTCQLYAKLTNSARDTSRHSKVHFNPSDNMILWNGTLWDKRLSDPVHHFDEFSDYGGGGFHPTRLEVIINSEVWDLRKFGLLRSVPSFDKTEITFNGSGDVIYAKMRGNVDHVRSSRVKHPLFAAFRTVDAVTYSDIATFPTTPLGCSFFSFSIDPTDTFVGSVTMNSLTHRNSSATLYEIGRKITYDYDPDDA